jgi:hypothetical protein
VSFPVFGPLPQAYVHNAFSPAFTRGTGYYLGGPDHWIWGFGYQFPGQWDGIFTAHLGVISWGMFDAFIISSVIFVSAIEMRTCRNNGFVAISIWKDKVYQDTLSRKKTPTFARDATPTRRKLQILPIPPPLTICPASK